MGGHLLRQDIATEKRKRDCVKLDEKEG